MTTPKGNDQTLSGASHRSKTTPREQTIPSTQKKRDSTPPASARCGVSKLGQSSFFDSTLEVHLPFVDGAITFQSGKWLDRKETGRGRSKRIVDQEANIHRVLVCDFNDDGQNEVVAWVRFKQREQLGGAVLSGHGEQVFVYRQRGNEFRWVGEVYGGNRSDDGVVSICSFGHELYVRRYSRAQNGDGEGPFSETTPWQVDEFYRFRPDFDLSRRTKKKPGKIGIPSNCATMAH